MNIEELKNGQKEIDSQVQKHADLKKAEALKNGVSNDNLDLFSPIKDGAFNYQKYIDASERILFIAREPNSPDVGGWDYKNVQIKNDIFFGSMNAAANGILRNNTAVSGAEILGDNEPLMSTAFINISNLPGGGQVGLQGNMNQLYQENKETFEKKLSVYKPDVIVCNNIAELTWDSLQKELEFKSYIQKNYDRDGNEIPIAENAATSVYYCDNGKIIIDSYHVSSQRYGNISQEGWVKGIVNGYKDRPRNNNQDAQKSTQKSSSPKTVNFSSR